MSTEQSVNSQLSAGEALEKLLSIVSKLRDPHGGCPWDLKQTFESLAPLLLDEGYEVIDALGEGDEELCEELGDLLSIIALFSQIAAEQRRFSFASVANGIASKLVRRHPHVFGELKVSSTEEVLANWEAIKEQERLAAEKAKRGLLDGIPRSVPALQRAHVIGERCAAIGFDWKSTDDVASKVSEELHEFLTEMANLLKQHKEGRFEQDTADRIREEFGDLLFSLTQYSRHLGFSAEDALAAANTKFISRFNIMEQLVEPSVGPTALQGLSSEELERLWTMAKEKI